MPPPKLLQNSQPALKLPCKFRASWQVGVWLDLPTHPGSKSLFTGQAQAHLILPQVGQALTLRPRLGQQLGVGHMQPQPAWQDAEGELLRLQGLPIAVDLQEWGHQQCIPA